MTTLFDDLPLPRIDELLILDELERELRRERWNNIVSWDAGYIAREHDGGRRYTIFCAVHLKHQRLPARIGLLRIAILRLIEQRAKLDLTERLCVVVDSVPNSIETAMLDAVDADWRFIEPTRTKPKTILVGPKHEGKKLKGPPAPWKLAGPIFGVAGRHSSGVGDGALVTTRMRFTGTGTLELPPTTTVVAIDPKYQNGVLLTPQRVRRGEEVRISFFCLNHDAAPNRQALRSSPRARYKLGPLVTDQRLLNLIELIAGKNLSTAKSRDSVQLAVWDIYEDGRMSSAVEEAIRSLPRRGNA